MIFMTVLRGIAWLGDWSKVLRYMVGTKPAFFCFVYAEVIDDSNIKASAGAQV